MAHVVFTNAATRIELNLDARQEAAVTHFLLGLLAAPAVVAAPGPVAASRVAEPEAAQVTAPTRPRLLPTTCGADGCITVFQPEKASDVYCSAGCRQAQHVAKQAARRAADLAGDHQCPECPRSFTSKHALDVHRGRTHKSSDVAQATRATVEHRCPDCGAMFDSGQALGGHRATHRTKGVKQPARSTARQGGAKPAPDGRGKGCFECACGRRFGTAEARGFHQEEEDCRYECGCGESFASAQAQALHQTRTHLTRTKSSGPAAPPKVQALAKSLHIPSATPEDRPFVCKEPGCGHPCRSRGELDSHRRAYHDVKHGLPKTTQVLGALSFPCPDCDRVYDDENRLVHHRRVIHDYQRTEPVHEVVVNTAAKAVKVG